MKLIGNYSDRVKNLIQGSESYSVPSDIFIPNPNFHSESIPPVPEGWTIQNPMINTLSPLEEWIWNGGAWVSNIGTAPIVFNSKYKVKLSVFKLSSFQESHILVANKDFYIKNNEIYLKPNELLDREEYTRGSYTLQFDFIERYTYQNLYLAEISDSRNEIRLRYDNLNEDELPQVDQQKLTNFLNEKHPSHIMGNSDDYTFNSFIELSGPELIPINNYTFDNVSDGVDGKSIILKLNNFLPPNISLLDKSLNIVTKFLESQTEDINFIDEDQTASLTQRGLPIDVAFLTENTVIDPEDESKNYNELSEGSLDIISDLNNSKKDINLNIDFSKFENHVFFGSAKTKLENFKSKAVKLEGLYNQLSASICVSSSADELKNRKSLFTQIRNEKENFTAYERFMYNDNQQTTINSAPGLGTNLAGNNFDNDSRFGDPSEGGFNYKIISGSNADGFEKLHFKTTAHRTDPSVTHLFTDKFHVEEPPFFNTNDFIYLSFILKHSSSIDDVDSLHMSGGLANRSFNSDVETDQYKLYNYRREEPLPFATYSGSAHPTSSLMNPKTTGSYYKRYIFRSQQNYFRPVLEADKHGADLFGVESYDLTSTEIEVLTNDNVRKASTSGSIGDGFAYGIRDSSGQQTQQIFPSVVDRNNLSNTFEFITGSFLPQGDLFPIFKNDAGYGESHFTDVRISYKDPSNVHPFNNVYRPPSGSYGGSDEWNDWYTNALATASLHDQNNVHSLVNNLPLSLRENSDHAVLRNFVHMLGEQFDLLRNYIDNYHNFYKLGYTNPNSMPDNLLPILGDTVGWQLLNTQGGSSIEDYAISTAGGEVGVQNVINATWKKILNNLIYVYKVKGTTESINSLLNLYGFDSSGFQMREYGGSTAEHNPTIITNDSEDFLEGMRNIKGNVSYIADVQPFSMMNFRGTNSLGVDWWRNDADANGVEFVFNADRSGNNQTILRSSGSNNDLWDLRVVPSGSNPTTTSSLEFRLNFSDSGSDAIGTNALSMSSPYSGDFTSGKIWNVFLQKNVVTGSNQHNQFTQSYHMFLARKDDDKIKNVSHISMSSDSVSAASSSHANYNFGNQHKSKALNNLFVGETLSGSLSEFRTWNAYVSMSKFKQHTINYQSTVGNKITSSVDDLIYRYPFNENIVNWSTNPNSASLKVNDANSKRTNDYSILISSQDNFNYRTTMTEQVFYKLSIKGMDKLPNDNQTNKFPDMTINGELNADTDIIDDPTDSSGQPERQFTNQFGRDVSYVNAIDSIIVNQIPDFRIDDFIGDPDEQDTETYEDLLGLRKALIGEPNISIDVDLNMSSVENLLTDDVTETIETVTPAKTNFELFYDIKNDSLFRSKLGKNAKIQTKLNHNIVIGKIDADTFDEPKINSFANKNIYIGSVDADSSDEPKVNSFINNNVVKGTVDINYSDEPKLSSLLNSNFTIGTIDADQWDEPKLNASYESFTSNTKINYIDLSNSKRTPVYNVTPKVGSHDMSQAFLGPKNHIGKNQGTGVNNRFFKSSNPGINGDFNTYKFENRFTFKTIGDVENFNNSSSHHDVFRSFTGRNFLNKNDVNEYKYKSFFGVGAGTIGNAPKDGRMVGRTRFYSSSNGEIFYPSNHYIHARTSKDALWKLIYEGTQHDGSNPTQDPIDRDPNPKSAAYIIRVGGADTVQRIRVERPVSVEQKTITIKSSGGSGAYTFELFKRSTSLGSVELHTRGDGGLERTGTVSFGLTGNIREYNFLITPSTDGDSISNARVVQEIINGRPARAQGSITRRRQRDGSMKGTITAIRDNFSIRVSLRN